MARRRRPAPRGFFVGWCLRRMAIIDRKVRYRRQAAICYDIATTMAKERSGLIVLLGDLYAANAVNPDGLPPNAFTLRTPSEEPHCAICGGEMQLTHSLSRANLPSIRAFWCEPCGQTLTWQKEDGSPGGQRWVGPEANRQWITRYIAVSFRRDGNDFTPGTAVECPDGELAVRRAELMIRERDIAGAVAFSRRCNAGSGEFDVAQILQMFGDVPAGFNIA